MRGRLVLVASLVLLASASTAPAQSEPRVAVKLFQFQPASLEVKRGTRVVWINHDDITHSATAGIAERRDGRFDLTLPGQGSTASVELKEPGVYPYFCERHPHMRGEIRVD